MGTKAANLREPRAEASLGFLGPEPSSDSHWSGTEWPSWPAVPSHLPAAAGQGQGCYPCDFSNLSAAVTPWTLLLGTPPLPMFLA